MVILSINSVDCGKEHIVGFGCKSRFCHGCGKRYVDNWVGGQVDKILEASLNI